MAYGPHTPADRARMLEALGIASVDELFADIPEELRASPLRLPEPEPEIELAARLERLAGRNRVGLAAFLGAGVYRHFTPQLVDQLLLRGEWYTAYTPYRATNPLASLTDLEDQNLQVLKRMASSARGDAQAKVMAALADSTTRRQLVMQLLAGAASDSTPGGLSGEPPAILKEETRPAHGNPTMKPDSVKQPEPPVTSKSTKELPANPQKPTPKVKRTPPGQANQPAPHSPPEKPTKVPSK